MIVREQHIVDVGKLLEWRRNGNESPHNWWRPEDRIGEYPNTVYANVERRVTEPENPVFAGFEKRARVFYFESSRVSLLFFLEGIAARLPFDEVDHARQERVFMIHEPVSLVDRC